MVKSPSISGKNFEMTRIDYLKIARPDWNKKKNTLEWTFLGM